ncbi:unnamed protein product [Pleuronectes platessa]|uniref:Uncharacterized protein n=1 Tax=Pleuronectes platessa TaxID=8262 RepID=A0A9N7VCN5_PLEPL|nr:unnamed protein product [Pleuronectes platessa]
MGRAGLAIWHTGHCPASEKKLKSLEVEAATCAKLTDLFGAGFTSPAAAGAPGDERGGLDNDERVEADMDIQKMATAPHELTSHRKALRKQRQRLVNALKKRSPRENFVSKSPQELESGLPAQQYSQDPLLRLQRSQEVEQSPVESFYRIPSRVVGCCARLGDSSMLTQFCYNF